ncbi:MAG: hypothetical protein PHP23_01640 [Desulfobacterales bacterium]|nr:hypothetical protein [Desulfobacterales bacterium]MDD4071398.1 hypothetical protein [Desulfobacterales bacterium]MDD4391443.1 hypothetical protein [Desulfobacterales bacterium]
MVTFTDPLRDLTPIDRLEGFRPDGLSMYQRVMVAAKAEHSICPPGFTILEVLSGRKRLTIGNCQNIHGRCFKLEKLRPASPFSPLTWL